MMKPLSVKWIIAAYDYLRSNATIISGGFVKAGIVEAVSDRDSNQDHKNADPFAHLDKNSRGCLLDKLNCLNVHKSYTYKLLSLYGILKEIFFWMVPVCTKFNPAFFSALWYVSITCL